MVKYWKLFQEFRKETGTYHLATPIHHGAKANSHGNCQENEIKDIQNEEELKPSLFGDDMIRYTENPKESTTIVHACTHTQTYRQKKIVELIKDFSKNAGYKINKKLVVFLY